MEDAEIEMNRQTLYRKYLAKLNDDLRSTVMSNAWPLDGPDKAYRKAKSWEEVAEAVELELESRADAKAPKDSLLMVGPLTRSPGGGSQPPGLGKYRCHRCKLGGHPQEACPHATAKEMGITEVELDAQLTTDGVVVLCHIRDRLRNGLYIF